MYPPLVAALLRGGKPHWNPTVRRMTALVLEGAPRRTSASLRDHSRVGLGKEMGGQRGRHTLVGAETRREHQ